MALKSYALTTEQRCADFMGLGALTEGSTKHTQIQRHINTVTDVIERYLGFRVKKTAYTNEVYSSNGGKTILLKNMPVVEGETFTLQRRTSSLNQDEWETVDGQYYHVDYDSGIIEAANGLSFSRGRQNYRASYTAGYNFDNSTTYLEDTQGAEIELAAWLLVTAVYNRRKGGVGIKSEAIGDYKVVYTSELFQSPEIKELLDQYARMDEITVFTPNQY